ncbi:MAG TPA: M48 family metalloprotease [Myxococcota bacterium]|nr:M48 family metalloprotease [Myxococcota bacterium]
MSRRRRAGVGTRAALALLLFTASACRSGALGDVALGRELATEIRRVQPLVRDPVVQAYLLDVARPLLEAAGPQPFSYRLFVLDDPTNNAVALPGGYVFVHRGALLSAGSSAEVAAVLAHEIGHVVRRHAIWARDQAWVQQYRHRATQSRLALHGLAVDPRVAELHRIVSSALFLSQFSQEQEMEADRFAVETLHAAGGCGLALVQVFETMAGQQIEAVPALFASHPPYALRISAIREKVARAGPCEVAAAASDDPLLGIQARLRAPPSLVEPPLRP